MEYTQKCGLATDCDWESAEVELDTYDIKRGYVELQCKKKTVCIQK